MKPNEIVELIKKSNPKVLGSLPEAKAAGLIRVALAQLGQHIVALNEGAVNVPGLGNFKIKQVEREKEGQKKTVKVVAFSAAKQKTKKDKSEKKQGKPKTKEERQAKRQARQAKKKSAE